MKLESIITDDLCEKVIDIVLSTKRIIEDKKKEEILMSRKGQGNFVTSIDKSVEKYLIDNLNNILPQAGFISEETECPERKEINWIIDPIDGTNNFINGFEYAISVALQIKCENVFGIVYAPSKDELYFGKVGSGAYKRANSGKDEKITVREFNEDDGIVLFGVPYNRNKSERLFNIANKLYPIASDLKRIGPASLDICTIAEGKGKLYFELDLEIWDVATGELILSEAGGEYCKLDDLFLFGSPKAIKEAKYVLMR